MSEMLGKVKAMCDMANSIYEEMKKMESGEDDTSEIDNAENMKDLEKAAKKIKGSDK